MSADAPSRYLAGYAPELLGQVRELIAQGRLAESLERRYPERHDVCSDGALYDYVAAQKSRYMRNAGPLAKVVYDKRLASSTAGSGDAHDWFAGARRQPQDQTRDPHRQPVRQAPAAFLWMIVVHELAHLKEREHGKPFYAAVHPYGAGLSPARVRRPGVADPA